MERIGKIKSIFNGKFYINNKDEFTELKVNDAINLNDKLIADSLNNNSSRLEILSDYGQTVVFSQGELLIDISLFDDTLKNKEVILSSDVTEEETVAGEEVSQDGGALKSNFNSRDSDITDIRSDLREGNLSIEQNSFNTLNTNLSDSTITLNSYVVNEGEKITITATLTNAPQTDLIITLNNGQIITILAGQITGSVTFTNPNLEDVYKDASKEVYTITNTILVVII